MLGGWLIDHLSWRAVFFINLPLAIVVIAIALRHVPESRNVEMRGNLDWPGALLVTLGLGGAPVYACVQFETGHERYGWLNRVQAVAKGALEGNIVTYEVYELR